MPPHPPLPASLLAWAVLADGPGCRASNGIPWSRRTASAAAAAAAAQQPPPAVPAASTSTHWLAELRRYTLHPASAAAFMAATSDKDALALRSMLPFIAMWTTEAGGGGATSLQTVTHLYVYESVAARTAARARVAGEAGWAAYLAASRPAVAHQANELLAVPADQGGALVRASQRPPPARGTGAVFELLSGLSRTALRQAEAHDARGASLLLSGTVIAGEGVGSGVQLWRHPTIEGCLGPRLDLGPGGASRRVRDMASRADRALLRAVPWSPLQ